MTGAFAETYSRPFGMRKANKVHLRDAVSVRILVERPRVRRLGPHASPCGPRTESDLRAATAPFGVHRLGSGCLPHGLRSCTSRLVPTWAMPPALCASFVSSGDRRRN